MKTWFVVVVLISAVAAQQPKPGAATATARTRVVINLGQFERADPAAQKRQATVAGGTRGAGAGPVAIAPMEALAYAATPRFAWTSAGATRRFVFILMDNDGEELNRATVSGQEYRYPASAPALEPGKQYRWTVQPESAAAGGPSEEARFTVMGGGDRKKIESALSAIPASDPDAAVKRIQALAQAGIWYDTLAALDDELRAHPNDPDLANVRAQMMEKVKK